MQILVANIIFLLFNNLFDNGRKKNIPLKKSWVEEHIFSSNLNMFLLTFFLR